ncbi:hypothetical protein HAX54_041832 [Datura stramonium]|uniref:Uncharacterized protein n=1 Tax=Datura stramonium TaxID=4076 RepID=A0ABS8VYJ5_DATST|nr:hypothetical protein [Datura stramonium]
MAEKVNRREVAEESEHVLVMVVVSGRVLVREWTSSRGSAEWTGFDGGEWTGWGGEWIGRGGEERGFGGGKWIGGGGKCTCRGGEWTSFSAGVE